MKTALKLNLFADTGWGKTKSIADLANAGFNVHVFNADNNLRIARDYLQAGKSFTHTDFNPADDKGWEKLKNECKLGIGPSKRKLTDLTPDDVLVYDTTTWFARLCLRYVLSANQKKYEETQGFNESFWGRAQTEFMTYVAGMNQEGINCNIIWLSHVEDYIPDPSRPKVMLVPAVLGKALSPEFSRVFTDQWRGYKEGEGENARYFVKTRTDNLSNLKCSSKALKDVEPADLGVLFKKALA